MVKEHYNNGTVQSNKVCSAAGSRRQILTHAIWENPDLLFTGTGEDKCLEEAEMLAKEALTGADAEGENEAIEKALHQLLRVMLLQDKFDSRELYLIMLRLIRFNQSTRPQTVHLKWELGGRYYSFAINLTRRIYNHFKDGQVIEATIVSDQHSADGNGIDEDEWNQHYMQMRAFYCLLSTVTIKNTIHR
jgi:hypothetical protein